MSRNTTAPARDCLRIVTRFGVFEADPDDLVHFPAGLPGFEDCRRFAVVSVPAVAPLRCLCAVGGSDAAFLVIDPSLVQPDYCCDLSEAERAALGATDGAPLVWLAIVTISDAGEAWANLRAPVVIAPGSMTGCQILTDDGSRPLRFPLTGV